MAYTSKFSRDRSRRRRQTLWRSTLWLLGAAALIGLGYSAYQTGTLLAEARVREIDGRLAEQTARLEAGSTDAARMRVTLAEARQAVVTLQSRYDADVPKGEPAEIYAVARERLAQGVPAARIVQVLRDAAVAKPCDTRVVRKRFALQQATRNAEDTAQLLEGLIQVSASMPGSGADAARTAVVTVTRAWVAEPLRLTGLPARQDIAINNTLLRLSVEAAEVAGYATASLSVCGKG
ncbi:MAG: hypothetical protein NT133_01865 [Alphaproteobacteria bacterium]|nr:hypothetical protein [Alphaproteobacteria bacterium]